MAASDIPILVKKVALAIFKSGYVKGNKFQRVQGAFDIARRRLVDQGFLLPRSAQGEPRNITLTGKGHKAESKHARDSKSRFKVQEWDKLYALIEQGEESPEEEQQLPISEAGDDREVRDERRRQRLARVAKHAPTPRPRRRTRRAATPRARRARRR